MSSRTLNPKSALPYFLSHVLYTSSRLKANPLTAGYAPPFQALRDEWKVIQTQDVDIIEALAIAQALVDEADDGLDDFASRLSKAVLVITKDDKQSPLYLHFFGKKTLSELCRPTLAGQLDTMRGWIPSLQKSPYPSLQALAPELEQLVVAADAADAARDGARQRNREFRDVGARRQFVDKLNAARKQLFGELAKLPFTNPALPSDFAERFFRSEAGYEEPEAPTVASVTSRIAEMEKALQAEKDLLAQLQGEAAAVEQAAAQQKADEAALAAVQKQMADLAKQAAELSQKLAIK
ncbi:MAG: hypothetical protein QM820_18440 [Minicystis sp.]